MQFVTDENKIFKFCKCVFLQTLFEMQGQRAFVAWVPTKAQHNLKNSEGVLHAMITVANCNFFMNCYKRISVNYTINICFITTKMHSKILLRKLEDDCAQVQTKSPNLTGVTRDYTQQAEIDARVRVCGTRENSCGQK